MQYWGKVASVQAIRTVVFEMKNLENNNYVTACC